MRLEQILPFLFCAILPARGFATEAAASLEAPDEAHCGTVDLRDHFGPTRNQQKTGWCYAYAYADLLGEQIGLRPPDMVSAQDVALTTVTAGYLEHKGKAITQRRGGLPARAAALYAERGLLCKESDLPSESMFNAVQPGDLTATREDWKRTFFLDQRLGEFYDRMGMGRPTITNPADPLFQKALLKTPLCSGAPAAFAPRDSARGLSNAANDWAASAYRIETEKKCKPDDRLAKTGDPTYELSEFAEEKQDTMDSMNAQLDRKKSLLISYNVCSLLSYASLPHQGACEHASLVVGRKWNKATRSCNFLVRNSWGQVCGRYKPGIQCEADGAFWVPATELVKKTSTTMMFE